MADNDMMIVPGFGQMTRAQVAKERQALAVEIQSVHLNAGIKTTTDEGLSRGDKSRVDNARDKLEALRKAHPVGAKKSVRLI